MKQQLMPIGRFSKMTRLSVKALRLYDETGLLIPAKVDDSSGYRYYEPSQANRAEAIRYLRAVDMPLADIAEVLESDDADARSILKRHHDFLVTRLADQERMIAYLERLIERSGVMPYQVKVEQVEPREVASVRTTVTLKTVGSAIGEGFGSLMGRLSQSGAAPTGAPLVVYHDVIDEETDGDIEICLPVSGPHQGLETSTIDGGPAAVTTHKGPYSEVGQAYHTLSSWVSEHGHEFAGPPREIYLNDPTEVDEADILTRVEWPIVEESA